MNKLDEILVSASKYPVNKEKTKQQIKELILDLMDDLDPFHTEEWYVELAKKVEEL